MSHGRDEDDDEDDPHLLGPPPPRARRLGLLHLDQDVVLAQLRLPPAEGPAHLQLQQRVVAEVREVHGCRGQGNSWRVLRVLKGSGGFSRVLRILEGSTGSGGF